MLNSIKKYIMKKISMESADKLMNIKIDYELKDEIIKDIIKDIKIDYKPSLELMNIRQPLINHDLLIKNMDLREQENFHDLLIKNMDLRKQENIRDLHLFINNMDLREQENRKQENFHDLLTKNEGPLLGTMDLRKQENFQKSLENVILFRTNGVRVSYYPDRASRISTRVESIVRGNRDLVLLLLLVYSKDNNIELLEDLIKNYSGSRVKMIERIHLLREHGELSIKSSERLDYIIKMSTFIEKQCRSNTVSVMNMVSSGNVDGLVQDIEERVKNLIGICIAYDKRSPASSLKDLSIDALVGYGLLK